MALVTNNIQLSPLEPADAEAITACMLDKEISENTLFIPFPYSLEEGQLWIEDNIIFAEENGFYRNLAVRNETGRMIGAIGFSFNHGMDADKSAIGYWLNKAYWNRGIMSIAIQKFCARAKEDYKMKTLEAYVFIHNIASQKTLLKAGFTQLHVMPGLYKKDGKKIDGVKFERRL